MLEYSYNIEGLRAATNRNLVEKSAGLYRVQLPMKQGQEAI